MPKPPYRKNSSAGPPATAEAGAAHVRDFVVKLYDRQDGQGVDWKLIAETLFRASFDVLDKLPDDACRTVAWRVHEGSYGRMTEGPKVDPAASKSDLGRTRSEPSNTADPKLNGPGR